MKRAALYLRVSTVDQTTANQERELREVAERRGYEIVKVYKDHGISGAKGRDKRPQFDALCKGATKQQFDLIMAWSVDRLGRSLQDLVVFLGEIHALKRFMQHLSHADGGCTLLEGGAPVAAHQDDRNIRPQESNLASELSAHEVGHRLIGQH